MNPIQQSWTAHCKGQYPREVAVRRYDGNGLFRFNSKVSDLIYNSAALIDKAKYYRQKDTPCYVTVYAFDEINPKDYNTAKLNTIFFDFDSEQDITLALNDALIFIKTYPSARVYFSGSKGFACYLDFPAVNIPPDLKKEALAALHREIATTLDIKTADTTVFGDLARVSRLPNTIHHKQYLDQDGRRWSQYCIPLSIEDLEKGVEHIRMLARTPRDFKIKITPVPEIANRLIALSNEVEARIERREIVRQLREFKKRLEPPRLQRNGICAGIKTLKENAVKKETAESRWYGGCALIRANQMWLNISKEETKEELSEYCHKCEPPCYDLYYKKFNREIDRLWDSKFTPCTFMIKGGLSQYCGVCDVLRGDEK